MLKNKNKVSKKWLFASLAVVLLAVGTLVTMQVADLGPFANVKKQTNDDGINYSPATDEEKKAAEDHKDDLANDDKDETPDTGNEPETPPANKQKVSPFITIANQFNDEQYGNRVEIRSYVSGILESTGKCTVTFTKGASKVTWETSATPDATTTVCDTAMVPRTRFPSGGTWTVSVKYDSPKATGTSDSRTVDIQ
jgi:hypothetical protein